jgi:hypothetical protein
MAANPGRLRFFVLVPRKHQFAVEGTNVVKKALNNVVGVLKGKSNPMNMFSGHYDHLGIGSPERKMKNNSLATRFIMVLMMTPQEPLP